MTSNNGFDKGKYCFKCYEPEQVTGVVVAQIDKGDFYVRSERFYFKPIPVCSHGLTAWYSLMINERDAGEALRVVRELEKSLKDAFHPVNWQLPKKINSKSHIEMIAETSLPKMGDVKKTSEFKKWQATYAKENGKPKPAPSLIPAYQRATPDEDGFL